MSFLHEPLTVNRTLQKHHIVRAKNPIWWHSCRDETRPNSIGVIKQHEILLAWMETRCLGCHLAILRGRFWLNMYNSFEGLCWLQTTFEVITFQSGFGYTIQWRYSLPQLDASIGPCKMNMFFLLKKHTSIGLSH